MRTSNKILLGIFVLPLLVITLINVALYAKYKSGHYVAMKTVQEDRYTRLPLKNISKISVYGLNNFNIIPSDSLKLEIEKDKNGHLHYAIAGDSLVIHGDSVITRHNAQNDIERSYQAVNLYVPGGAFVTADNSDITLNGSKDSLHAASFHFILTNETSFKIDENDGEDSTAKYFNGLKIQGNNSAGISLSAYSHILDVQLTMIESAFDDKGALINKLTIDADKESHITLKGDNLKRVNTVH